jgi:bifunctional non-homologous end joining protein LigD
MTLLVPELAELPADVQLDGELIAWGDDNNPDFHRLGRRMLHGDRSIPVTYMVFDVLALDGAPTLRLPYAERHALLEEIVLDAPPALVEVVGSFEDGPALWDVIVKRGMEGVVAKRARQSYRPGSRLWVKTKKPRDGAVPGGARRRPGAAAPAIDIGLVGRRWRGDWGSPRRVG